MPDRIDEVFDTIRASWFIGGNAGPKYVDWLTDKLRNHGSRRQLDKALSLGLYRDHSEERKRKRAAIRATLLSAFVAKGTPTAMKDILRRRLEPLSLDQLKAAFRSQFPAFDDGGKRALWAPHQFTALATLNALTVPGTDWRANGGPDYVLMIHTLKSGSEGTLLDTPEQTFTGWDAISMSVVTKAKPHAYSNFGLIISVSENNILVTSPGDAWFDNRAGGTSGGNKSEGLSMSHHILQKNKEVRGMLSPAEVVAIQNTDQAFLQHFTGANRSKYNEIVVTGRVGVKLPHGTTGRISVIGMFMHVKLDGSYPAFYTTAAQHADPRQIQPRLFQAANRLGVPLLYIPTTEYA